MTDWLLPLAVAAVAVLYSSVGHAGATGYIAVMGLAGLGPEVIRPTALVLNVAVSTIGTVQFARAGLVRRDLVVPLGLAGVPAAALGGWLALPAAAFEGVLGAVLALAAVRVARAGCRHDDRPQRNGPPDRRLAPAALAAIGGGLGFIAGLTGVGGGVFLTPLLLGLRLSGPRQVAATTVVFILVNSLAGLAGWLAAGREVAAIDPPLVAAAMLGGLAGSHLGAVRLPVRSLRLLMALVLAVASAKLLGGVWAGGRA